MLDRLKNTIKKFNMLEMGDTVVVCLSGGMDSVVLFHALSVFAAEYKLSIIIAHLNHCLRGNESDRDEAFVRKLARDAKVKIAAKRVDVKSLAKGGDSLQDVARKARYDFFEEVAKRHKADRIATGHNLDDQAETVIMRFLKGAGLRGLSGIPPVRGKYIRPLIEISRKEIEEYAESHNLRFVRDSSNKSIKYLRNRIRLKLLPILTGYNPSITNDMAGLSRTLARDEDYLENCAKDAYKNVVMKKDKNSIFLSLDKLNILHDAIRVRMLFAAAEEILGSSKGFYSCHAEDFLKLLSSRSPNAAITLPNGLSVYKEYDVVSIEKCQWAGIGSRNKDISFEQELKINGKTKIIADCVRIAEFETRILDKSEIRNPKPASVDIACFDYDKLKLPLIIRNFRLGDRFIPFGMKGHKKVKEIFIEKKIPKRRRDLVPILTSGDEVVWVAGIRQAGHGKVEPETKRVLKIEMISCAFLA